jgi:ribosome maturation protein SDO1
MKKGVSSSNENQNNDSQILATNNNSRKAQKAAQKKSKKAKRREKEEHAERGERIAAEKTRQRERAERLGIVEGDGSTTALSSENNVIQQGGDGAVQGTDVKPCNTCGGAFTSGEYRMHFRSDWHRYNVKLKMKNVPPVSEQEFLLCDSDAFFEL